MAEKLKIASRGQGIPLVLIHGWGLNSAIWQPIADKLSAYVKVITVDIPVYGTNKSTTVNPYTLTNICQSIVSTINEPAIYAGWSLGGLIATEIAHTHKSDTLGLITIASSPFFTEELKPSDTHNWPGIKPQVLEDFHQQLSVNPQKTIEAFLKIQAMGSPSIRHDLKLIKSLMLQLPTPEKHTLKDSLTLLATVDQREILPTLTLPFLRLYGEYDTLVPVKLAELVSDLSPKSEQYIIKKASHAPFISHPDEFFQLVTSWLKKQYPKKSTTY